jgi:hypothetical protein
MKLIAKALLDAQMEMGNAIKDSTNPFFKSKYADLNAIREACMPLLNKYGIVVLQPTFHLDGKNYVKTILLHESGEMMESLTEILYSKQNDAQAQGSGITYARRYGLQSFVNIGADDDDGNGAVKVPEKKTEIKKSNELLDNVEKINACTRLPQLQDLYLSFNPDMKKALLNDKDKKKAELEQLELYHKESEIKKQS